MSSHSGTIGRSRGPSIGSQIKRQLSVEWQRECGYSSSDDDERFVPSIDTALLASLIAQNQFSGKFNFLFNYLQLCFHTYLRDNIQKALSLFFNYIND